MAAFRGRVLWNLSKTTFKQWREDKVSRLAAALSFYTAISVAPLLVLTLTVAGMFLDTDVARQRLSAEVANVVGSQGAEILTIVLKNADRPQAASMAGVLGILVLLWGASNVFAQLQDALNSVWDVELKPSAGIWATARERFVSFGMVVVFGFLLLVSLVLSAIISFLGSQFTGMLPGTAWLWQAGNLVVSFLLTTLIFGLIYKVLPEVKIGWRDVWSGALVTALLFTAGKYVLGLYLGVESISSAYGAAGSLIVFLIWMFFSAQTFLIGAEFTQVYARRMGDGLEPIEHARLSDPGLRRAAERKTDA